MLKQIHKTNSSSNLHYDSITVCITKYRMFEARHGFPSQLLTYARPQTYLSLIHYGNCSMHHSKFPEHMTQKEMFGAVVAV